MKNGPLCVGLDTDPSYIPENILNQLGISLNEAIRMFLMQVIIHKGIPFKPTLKPEYKPNEMLQQVIADVENKKDLTRYKNTDEMWQDLGL